MGLSRRDFIKTVTTLGAAAAVQIYKPAIVKALESAASGEVHVAWIQGASDTGCTISLLQTADPDLVEAVTWFRLSIDFHPTIMIPAGEEAMQQLEAFYKGEKGLDVLIVEGAVPEGYYCTVGEENGKPVPFEEWVRRLGAKAKYVVAVGTCATWGGIPAGAPNPTKCRGVKAVLPEKTVVNIPGCPAHPDWILLTLAPILLGHGDWIVEQLDEKGRPRMFFFNYIHSLCPRRQHFENLMLAKKPGEEGCLWLLGCKGPITKSDCSYRKWNGGTNFCILANAPCIGCVEEGFPDEPFAPFYERIENLAALITASAPAPPQAISLKDVVSAVQMRATGQAIASSILDKLALATIAGGAAAYLIKDRLKLRRKNQEEE